jgi:hypothetical protein
MSDGRKLNRVSISVLLLAALVSGIPSLIYPFGKDQGIYAWIGHLVLNGAVPYRDAWEPKPPFIFYTYALAEWVFGYSMLSIRWLDLIWQTTAMFFIYGIARRLSGRELPGVIAGITYVAAYWSQGFWHTAQSDGFTNLFIAAAVWIFLKMLHERASPVSSVVAGVLVGFAFYFKYPVALIIPFLAIVMLCGGVRRTTSALIFTVAGFAAVVVGYLVYLYANAGLDEFFYIQFVHVPRYLKLMSSSLPESHGPLAFLRINDLFGSYFIYPPLFLLSLAAYFVSLITGKRTLDGHLVAAWGAVSCISLCLQRKFYIYHFTPLLPPLSIGAAFAVCAVFEKRYRKEVRSLILLGIVGVCAFSWIYVNPRYSRYCLGVYLDSWKALAARVLRGQPLDSYYMNIRFTSDDYSIPADMAVANYIAMRTKPGDTIYIWGIEPTVYWLAKRSGPTPFIHNFALRTKWAPERYGKQLLESLKKKPPRYFLVVRNDSLPWMIGTSRDSATDLLRYPALKQWLDKNYLPEEVIEDFVIYVRRH